MLPNVIAAFDVAKALPGVIAGGLVATLLTLLVTGARERRKTRREDAAAVQLIIFELGNAQRGASYIQHGEPWTGFPITAWEEGRLRLARFLDPEAWMLVAAAYNSIHGFNWRYQLDQDRATGGGDGKHGNELDKEETRNDICASIQVAAGIAIPLLRDGV